jgi:cyclopropane fatty-acyl-phospholipid synthase-like methyltransferase
MLKAFMFTLLLVTVSCTTHKKHAHHHRFDDVKKWSRIFEDEKREEWQNSKKIIRTVGIQKDSLIADIGSATGYFPVRIAKVAIRGRVWGIDIEPNLVNYLNQRAKKEGIKNLYSILGTFSDPLIPEKVDFIFIVDTYHHISQRKTYFEKLRNSLKPNGKIVIIDFRKGKLPFGPKDHAKISKNQIISELIEAGYKVDSDHIFLKYQNFLIFN